MNFQRLRNWSLCFILVLVMVLPFGAPALGAAETPQEGVAATLEYYRSVQNKSLTSFWETLALCGAGENFRDGTWLLPVLETGDSSSTADRAGAILNELAKGEHPEAWIGALSAQQNADGSFDGGTNSHIFAMIALDAGQGSYDRQAGLAWLVGSQYANGGFSWADGIDPDVDITGMALIVLGRYTGADAPDAEQILAGPAAEAALAFLEEHQVSSGGFAGAYGANANTDAAAVMGLVAAGEDVDGERWTTAQGYSPLDCLLGYRADDNGFGWEDSSSSNAMATAQVLLALDDLAAMQSTFYRLAEASFNDVYIYFTGNPVQAGIGETISLRLMAAGLDPAGIPQPVEGAVYTVVNHDSRAEVVPETGDEGYVSLAFEEAGTYVLQADVVLGGQPKTAALTIVIPPSDAPPTIEISIRVEGAYNTIAQTASFAAADDGDLRPAEAVAQFLDREQIPYVLADYSGTKYISAINGETAGLFGGYDGWLGAVNGNLNASSLNDGDQLLFFYGDWPSGTVPSTYIPIIDADLAGYERGDDLEIQVTAAYDSTVYDENWNPISTTSITIELPDVDVKLNSWAGKTDGSGRITIPGSAFTEGRQKIFFSQEKQNASPGIVRTALEIRADSEPESSWIELTVQGLNGVILFSGTLDWQEGDTALSVLVDHPELEVVLIGSSGGRYVQSINGLAELEYGPASGWTYIVDGEYPSVSADGCRLSAGQSLRWVYTQSSLGIGGEDEIRLVVTGLDGEIFFSGAVDWQEGDTALSVLLDQPDLEVKTTGSAGIRYVQSVNGLAEFDHGPASGWTYTVDGIYPSLPADVCELSSGETLKWLYQGGPLPTSELYDPVELDQILDELIQTIVSQGIQDELDIVLLARHQVLDSSLARQYLISSVRDTQGSFSKSTDLAKILMAAQATGLDPKSIEGFDLLDRLYQFANITRQGVNAPVFALLAYDALEAAPTPGCINTRDKLIEAIMGFQNENGGFALGSGGNSDPDLTAMALTALSSYEDRTEVKKAIARGLNYLAGVQQKDGSLASPSGVYSETLSQVIIALCALNIDLSDARFVKENGNLLNALMAYKTKGGFSHIRGGQLDAMATRQAALALTAYQAFIAGQPGIYDLTRIKAAFWDLDGVPWAREAISDLSRQQVLNGYGDGSFRPQDLVSREQMVTLLMRGLYPGFEAAGSTYTDVPGSVWYAPYVGAAQQAGLVKGTGAGRFGSGYAVTRQDLAVMACNTALKAGIPLAAAAGFSPEPFTDAAGISDYAAASVDRLRAAGIIAGRADGSFDPAGYSTRAEAAVIAWQLIKRV